MTQRLDVARGHAIIERWCVLAEQRLEHLGELFETGRWRRYHSEQAFLENIQEAKTAVETWRSLLTREANRDNSPLDMSWLGRTQADLPRFQAPRDRIQQLPHTPAETAIAVSEPVESAPICPAEMESVPERETPALGPLVFGPALLDARILETAVAVVLDEPVAREAADDASAAAQPALVGAARLMLDIDAIEQRYPLLRNAL